MLLHSSIVRRLAVQFVQFFWNGLGVPFSFGAQVVNKVDDETGPDLSCTFEG